MGDRVAVLRAIHGRAVTNLQQIDSPRRLYDEPDNLFVAGFIGSPSMNFAYGNISGEGDRVFVSFCGEKVEIARSRLSERPRLADYKGKEVILGVRPESFEIVDAASSDVVIENRTIDVETQIVEQLGSEAFVHFTKPFAPVLTEDLREAMEGSEDEVAATETKFTARVHPDHAPRPLSNASLVVDTSKLHFFDKETGDAIR